MQTSEELERKACNEFPTLATTASSERSSNVAISAVQQVAPGSASHQTIDFTGQYAAIPQTLIYASDAMNASKSG